MLAGDMSQKGLVVMMGARSLARRLRTASKYVFVGECLVVYVHDDKSASSALNWGQQVLRCDTKDILNACGLPCAGMQQSLLDLLPMTRDDHFELATVPSGPWKGIVAIGGGTNASKRKRACFFGFCSAGSLSRKFFCPTVLESERRFHSFARQNPIILGSCCQGSNW